jgi:hypothetical protein
MEKETYFDKAVAKYLKQLTERETKGKKASLRELEGFIYSAIFMKDIINNLDERIRKLEEKIAK